jgi:hypothetical protein
MLPVVIVVVPILIELQFLDTPNATSIPSASFVFSAVSHNPRRDAEPGLQGIALSS